MDKLERSEKVNNEGNEQQTIGRTNNYENNLNM